MLKIGVAILLAALSPFEINHSLFEGVWVGIADKDPENNHTYLRIDDSKSGRFVLMSGGTTVYDFEFTGQDITEPEGYLELSKLFGDSGVKILLSGWVSEDDGGAGLLTGVAYMYEVVDGNPKLFNTILLRMSAMGTPLPQYGSDLTALTIILERYGEPESTP